MKSKNAILAMNDSENKLLVVREMKKNWRRGE